MDTNQSGTLTRAVVTGAAGFIGAHLVRHLRERGIDVWGIDRCHRAGAEQAVDETADIGRDGVLDAHLDNRTAVFHMAGAADVRGSVRDPARDFRHNVVITLGVLDAVRRAGASVVFPSTGSVYDPTGPLPFTEDAAVGPSSPYGAGKIAAEAYCAAYFRTFGIDVRVARIFSVYGPGMRRFAIYDFCKRLQAKPERLEIRGSGRQTRHYIYVEDVARVLTAIAERGRAGEIYNVAAGEPMTIVHVAREVARAMGLENCEVVPDQDGCAAELDRMEADVSKLARLDPGPTTDFREALRATVRFLTSPETRGGSSDAPVADVSVPS